MNKWQKDVEDFHKAIEAKIPKRPSLMGYNFRLRGDLLREEVEEFISACADENNPDWPGMIDALIDVIYIAIGGAVTMGVDLEPFWAEVHSANMRKVGGPRRADGKILKRPDWVGPDIEGVLRTMREKSREKK